jgi:geranylgeranyl pyrophosphate synthase
MTTRMDQDFQRYLGHIASDVELELSRLLEGVPLPHETTRPDGLLQAMRYAALGGGKRLRPFLLMTTARLFEISEKASLRAAAALEMVHCYSLVHDDLPAMDDDDLRRGKPTSHKVFGEAIAILAGDALLTRAFHLMADVPDGWDGERARRRLHATAILGLACGTTGLIGGQVMDLESEGRKIGGADLERLHRAKTGALLGACVRGGAVLGGAAAGALAALERYAGAVGLAFQIVDDVLDATEDAAHLGKTAGKDAMAEKATYVSVHGVERARAMAVGLLEEALSAVAPLGPRGELLAALARLIVDRRG